MTMLTIEDLKNFIDKLPDDYYITFQDKDGTEHQVADKFEVNLSMKKLVLKSH